MATIKHISSKNSDYGAAEEYLTFEHDEFTIKPVLDENGRLIPRTDCRMETLNCGNEESEVMEMCHGAGLYQIDLLSGSKTKLPVPEPGRPAESDGQL